MAIELEGLEFQIEAKSEQGSKGIDSLISSLDNLKQATKGGLGLTSSIKKLNQLNEALKGFHTEKLESLSRSLSLLSSLGNANVSISPAIPKRISELGASLRSLTDEDISRLERVGNALKNMGVNGAVRIPKLNINKATPTNVTPKDSPIGVASAEVQSNALKSVLNGLGGAFSNMYKTGAGYLQKLGDAFAKVKTTAQKCKTALDKFKELLAPGLSAKVRQTTAGLGRLFSSLKRIAMYRLIRSALSALTKAMREGINNVYQYSNAIGGTLAQSMDRLSTSGLYLKNSLGAMAAPIINALAPAIDFVIDKIVTLLNLINMLFARLSGASVFTKAKKSATSFGTAVSGAGGAAGKAAKEIRDATTGIDELNIIMDKNNSGGGGGGGGGGGTDFGSMFEEVPIDSSVSDFVDRLKAAFEAGDWQSLGTILGSKVNELIDGINWGGIGEKIGYWFNASVQTAYYFLDTVDFNNLGSHFAELINEGLEEVDGTFVGRIVTKWFTLKPDFLIGWLTELDWGLVAKTVSDTVTGIFKEITDFFKKYDWSELGTIFWTKIKDAIDGVDWGSLVASMFTAWGTAISSAGRFIGGFFGSIVDDIKNWWNEDIKNGDWDGLLTNLFYEIGEAEFDIGKWVVDNIVTPFISALLGEHNWDNAKGVGVKLFNKVLEGWNSVSVLPKNIGKFFVNVANNSKTWWKNVKTWWSDKVGNVQSFVTDVKNEASEWWSNTKSYWSEKVGDVEEFVTNVKNDASSWWSNVKKWWSQKAKEKLSVGISIVNNLSQWWSTVKRWWSNVAGNLTTKLSIKTPTIKIKWTNVKVFGKKYEYPSGFDIKWNAKGAILDGAQLFGRIDDTMLGGGEAGREAVLPLENHTDWMDTLAEKVRNGLPEKDSSDMGYDTFKRALAEFYEEYVRGTMVQMASDMNRQANKKELTTVKIGDRTITDAVVTQEKANGYRF